MRVQKIRLTGFKSFADETIITIEDGITAIVGPNGCGKSNILDAVRWVLGEKSGRALRGQSMEDVIFLGSEQRKQSGMSEVEIYFDNSDHSLNVATDEVIIGRRLYLNSPSEYYLNSKRTTRREIEAVLMDTGIGKSAYSIMEQGRISEILKSSPENRRELLDEAAGISKFKADRKETLGSLHETQQNLLRLNDILKSKESEIKKLEAQATKTRQYIGLKEKLDQHDQQLRFLKFKELTTKDQDARKKLDTMILNRDDCLEKVKIAENEIREFETSTNSRLSEMHQLDRKFHQDLSSLDNMKASIKRLEFEKDQRIQKKTEQKKRKEEENENKKSLDSKHQGSVQLELDLKADIKTRKSESINIEASILELRKSIRFTIDKDEKNQKQILQGDQKQAQLIEELKNVTRDLILELEQHKKELEKREDYRSDLKEKIMNQLHHGCDGLSEVIGLLEESNTAVALKMLTSINLENVLDDFKRYEAIEQEFRSLFFDRSGLLAKKEQLDIEMNRIGKEKESLQRENSLLNTQRNKYLSELEKMKNRNVELELEIRNYEVKRESSEENRQSLTEQLEATGKRLNFHNKQIDQLDKELEGIEQEKQNLIDSISSSEKRIRQQSGDIEKLKILVEKSRNNTEKIRSNAQKLRDKFEALLPGISIQERQCESYRLQISTMEEDLYNDYQMSPGELEELYKNKRIKIQFEEQKFRHYQIQIKELGAFNALAIEELERAREGYEELTKQQNDINQAKENILSILKEINEKSQEMFKDTFDRIQVNFTEIFQSLFGGGHANLTLTDPEDPLHSGVEIMVQPSGKKNTSLSLLSGGEQSMTAIALMFAIYLVRPSPFCFLDEIDAPLDDANVNLFIKMLNRFTPRTQFLVITHNKITMANSGAIFGITQEEAGVSKLISVNLNEDGLQKRAN